MNLRFIARSFKFFYSLRRTRKSLRKLFRRLHNPLSFQSKNKTFFLERRADILFYRANLSDNIKEARYLIKTKQCFLLLPKSNNRKFITAKLIIKPYTQIPLFSFLGLTPQTALKRKLLMLHALRAHNKLLCLAPKWLYINYNLMLAILIHNPFRIRYPFVSSEELATFMGASRYF